MQFTKNSFVALPSIITSTLIKVCLPKNAGKKGVARPGPTGLFYKNSNIPVAKDDLVALCSVQFNDKSANAVQGIRDKHDILNGPWKIVDIHKSRIHTLEQATNKVAKSSYKRPTKHPMNPELPAEEEYMLTSMVKLSFYKGPSDEYNTKALSAYVPLSDIVPLYTTAPAGVTVYPHCLAVEKMKSFKALVEEAAAPEPPAVASPSPNLSPSSTITSPSSSPTTSSKDESSLNTSLNDETPPSLSPKPSPRNKEMVKVELVENQSLEQTDKEELQAIANVKKVEKIATSEAEVVLADQGTKRSRDDWDESFQEHAPKRVMSQKVEATALFVSLNEAGQGKKLTPKASPEGCPSPRARKRKADTSIGPEPEETPSHADTSPESKKRRLDADTPSQVKKAMQVKKAKKSFASCPSRLSSNMGTKIGKEPMLYFAAVAEDTYVALKEMGPFNSNDQWEVEKLRGKRVRVLEKSEKNITKFKDMEGKDDSWVKKVIEEYPGAKDKIVVAEHKVHWCGWPDEDDTWEFRDNVEAKYANQYDTMMDGVEIKDINDVVYEMELPCTSEEEEEL